MIAGCTAMARLLEGSNQYRPAMECMLPSNIKPTMFPERSINGLPELPPTISLLVDMQNGVFMSSCAFAFTQLAGILNGAAPVARSNARPRYVKGATGTPFSTHP